MVQELWPEHAPPSQPRGPTPQWPPPSLDEAPPVSVQALATHSPLPAEPGPDHGCASWTGYQLLSRAVRWERSSGAGIELGHQTLCICDQQPLCLGAGCCHLGALRAGTVFLLPWADSRGYGKPSLCGQPARLSPITSGETRLKRQGLGFAEWVSASQPCPLSPSEPGEWRSGPLAQADPGVVPRLGS